MIGLFTCVNPHGRFVELRLPAQLEHQQVPAFGRLSNILDLGHSRVLPLQMVHVRVNFYLRQKQKKKTQKTQLDLYGMSALSSAIQLYNNNNKILVLPSPGL
jgi:hypothetical protein